MDGFDSGIAINGTSKPTRCDGSSDRRHGNGCTLVALINGASQHLERDKLVIWLLLLKEDKDHASGVVPSIRGTNCQCQAIDRKRC